MRTPNSGSYDRRSGTEISMRENEQRQRDKKIQQGNAGN